MTHGDIGATMPGAALGWLVAGYGALGLDLDGDLGAAGIAPAAVRDDPQTRVSLAAYTQLLGRALARDPAFAVTAGLRCPFGTFPLLDCTIAACASLREALHALDRYFALVTGNGRWVLRGGVLELAPNHPLPEWLRVASFEFGLHYTAARIDELASGPVVRGLEVSWPEPAWSSSYPRPTTFAASRAALLLDEGALDAPSRRADPMVAELLARSAASVLASQPAGFSVRVRVQEAVVACMPQGLPQM